MRVGPLLAVTAFVALVFGLALALIPDAFVSVFGLTYDIGGNLTARVLGGAWLGYAVLNWLASSSSAESQRQAMLADVVQSAVGFFVSLYAAASGAGNAVMWFWVVLFLAFGAAYVYLLWIRPPAAERAPRPA